MAERIDGQVAQILNARELVINRGEMHGVEVGMRFAVLNSRGTRIIDPETNKEIGPVELPKVLVKVVRVQVNLAVARTFRTTKIPGGSLYTASPFESLMRSPKVIPETLKTDERRLQDELDETESYVKIGDPVVQAIGDAFDDPERDA